jgi:multidrug efflux pump
VRKVDADAQPIIFFAVRAPQWSRIKLSDWVERVLVDRFSTIDGVAQVNMVGQARPAMRIWLDADRLAAFRLTPGDIEDGLRRQNVELPAGRVEAAQQNISLRVDRRFQSPKDFAALVIGRGPDGYLVRLGDVARVEQGPENPYASFRYNGETGVGLAIIRQSGANTLAVANAAKALADRLRADLPDGVSIDVGSDSSLFIDRAIKAVWKTLAEAAALVVLVIFVFLGSWRATLIPAVTVPICLLATFAVLWMLGYSINLLTLLALVLAIGLVVDDAIVVLENVHHRVEQGEEPLVAGLSRIASGGVRGHFDHAGRVRGVRADHVHRGQTGRLFRELAVAMIAALALSGFLALSLAPMLCSKLLKRHEPGRFAAMVQNGLTATETAINARSRPRSTGPMWVGAGGRGAVRRGGAAVPLARNRIGAARGYGRDRRAPECARGHQLRRPRRLCAAGRSGAEADRRPGRGARRDHARARQLRSVRGLQQRLRCRFSCGPWEQRDVTSAELARQLTRRLRELPALRGNATVRSSISRGRGQPIGLVIAGAEYDELALARDRILAATRDVPGIVNLDADYVESKPQLLIDVDTRRAGDLGVSVDAVSQALQTLMGIAPGFDLCRGRQGISGHRAGRSAGRSSEARLGTIFVRGGTGDLVPLSNLVSTREGTSARELGRFNKMRAITLQGGLAGDMSLGRALDTLRGRSTQVARSAVDRLSRRKPVAEADRRVDLADLRPDRW